MKVVSTRSLKNAFENVVHDHNFKVVEHENGDVTVQLPNWFSFLLEVEDGVPESCNSSVMETEESFWDWDINGNEIAVIKG